MLRRLNWSPDGPVRSSSITLDETAFFGGTLEDKLLLIDRSFKTLEKTVTCKKGGNGNSTIFRTKVPDSGVKRRC